MPPEFDSAVDELADLRRRAYGPGGDIDADPTAQARLAELEAAERETRDGTPERDLKGHGKAPDPSTASSPSPASTDADTPESDEAEPQPPLRARLSWRRHPRLPWMVAAAAAVVAVVALASTVAGELSKPHPELSFAVTDPPGDAVRPPLDSGAIDYWGIENSALDYRGSVGHLDIWTLTSDQDVACIFFSTGGEYWGQNCAVRPLSTIVDFRSSPDTIPADSLSPEVPAGSFIRFAWEGDVVNVYVVRLNAQADAPAT
jgi:hypothetical protein